MDSTEAYLIVGLSDEYKSELEFLPVLKKIKDIYRKIQKIIFVFLFSGSNSD